MADYQEATKGHIRERTAAITKVNDAHAAATRGAAYAALCKHFEPNDA